MKVALVLDYVKWEDCPCINQQEEQITYLSSWQEDWHAEEPFP